MFKSVSLALLAFVAAATSVSAQAGLPNHTYFTNPLDQTPAISYNGGDKVFFSWNTACVAPAEYTATDPKAAEVQLINSTNSTNAFFISAVTTIDCTQNQGNTEWTIPADKVDPNAFYSLKIVLSQPVYSGRFKIVSKNAPAPAAASPSAGTAAGGKAGTSAASGLSATMAVSGAALVASAAMMFL